MYNGLGSAQLMQGDFEQSEQNLGQSLHISREINYYAGVSEALLSLGIVAHFRNQPERSNEFLLESLAISRERKDLRAAADALNNLGSYASVRGEYLTPSVG